MGNPGEVERRVHMTEIYCVLILNSEGINLKCYIIMKKESWGLCYKEKLNLKSLSLVSVGRIWGAELIMKGLVE